LISLFRLGRFFLWPSECQAKSNSHLRLTLFYFPSMSLAGEVDFLKAKPSFCLRSDPDLCWSWLLLFFYLCWSVKLNFHLRSQTFIFASVLFFNLLFLGEAGSFLVMWRKHLHLPFFMQSNTVIKF
jgi:hypothetical protein